MRISRRKLLQGLTASTLAAAALEPRSMWGADRKRPLLPIVDTHQHLWDLDKLRLPWIKSGTPLHRNYLTEDYLKAGAGLNVVKAVYMEVAVVSADRLAEAEYVVDLCRRDDHPTVAAVIGGEPENAERVYGLVS